MYLTVMKSLYLIAGTTFRTLKTHIRVLQAHLVEGWVHLHSIAMVMSLTMKSLLRTHLITVEEGKHIGIHGKIPIYLTLGIDLLQIPA